MQVHLQRAGAHVLRGLLLDYMPWHVIPHHALSNVCIAAEHFVPWAPMLAVHSQAAMTLHGRQFSAACSCYSQSSGGRQHVSISASTQSCKSV